MKSGNLNFLETSGPLQACNGTDILNLESKRRVVFGSTSCPLFSPDRSPQYYGIGICVGLSGGFGEEIIIFLLLPGFKPGFIINDVNIN